MMANAWLQSTMSRQSSWGGLGSGGIIARSGASRSPNHSFAVQSKAGAFPPACGLGGK
jgi:hypothetical protein